MAKGIWQFFERRTTITKWGLFQECKIVSPLENRSIKKYLIKRWKIKIVNYTDAEKIFKTVFLTLKTQYIIENGCMLSPQGLDNWLSHLFGTFFFSSRLSYAWNFHSIHLFIQTSLPEGSLNTLFSALLFI